MVPGDLATIYNLNPLFAKGITGKGQTIVVIEDTNVYSTSDWTTFRSTFGLSGYTSGSFTQVHPDNCSNPGVVAGNDAEAILDAEWSSAAAPNAAIELASCSDTTTTFGGLIALQNLLNTGTPPSLVSISYGECEADNGAAANATYLSAYRQAATEGVSVFAAAGDEGAASCDAGTSYATHGVSVSALASTPYNVAVGGTDFGDSYAGTNSTYWNATNTSTFESAKSYIPEIPWNDSCAGTLLTSYLGYSQSWGPSGFCNSFYAYLLSALEVAGGSGGPSACATGSPSVSGVVVEAAKDTPSRVGKRGFSEIPTMEFAIFQTSRCLPPMAPTGAITTSFAGAIRPVADLPAQAIPALGRRRAGHRSPHPLWRAYRRSSIRAPAAAGVIPIQSALSTTLHL